MKRWLKFRRADAPNAWHIIDGSTGAQLGIVRRVEQGGQWWWTREREVGEAPGIRRYLYETRRQACRSLM